MPLQRQRSDGRSLRATSPWLFWRPAIRLAKTLSENGKSGIVSKTARIRRIGCRQHSRQPRKSSSSSLRRMLLLPLDDLLAITREFLNPDVSRSGLSRCLRRHEVGSLNALKPKVAAAASKKFKAYEPGFLHIDVKYLPQMPDETKRRYLFVAIDLATRWVFVRIMSAKTAAN